LAPEINRSFKFSNGYGCLHGAIVPEYSNILLNLR